MELMQAFGETVDDETRETMSSIAMVGPMIGNAVPITAHAAGCPGFKLVASLTPAHLRVDIDQLDGESTLLGKIQRKLGPEERYTALDFIPGIRSLLPSDRREMEADFSNSPDFPDLIIEGPLAVVTPIAIYR
jgi:hypothetical protein